MGPWGTAARLTVALWAVGVSAMAMPTQFLSIGHAGMGTGTGVGQLEWEAALVGGLASGLAGGLLETWAGMRFTCLERILWWTAVTTLLVYLSQYVFPMTFITVWGAFLAGLTVGVAQALLPSALVEA